MEKLIGQVPCVDRHGRTSIVYMFQNYTDATPYRGPSQPIKGTERACLLNGQPLRIMADCRFETEGGLILEAKKPADQLAWGRLKDVGAR